MEPAAVLSGGFSLIDFQLQLLVHRLLFKWNIVIIVHDTGLHKDISYRNITYLEDTLEP